ncbi:acyl-CoA dehydrogenase [Acinetobacter sp. NIPH 2377]|uniref:acyl-CoA dehydrogenase C-terminal domain-containing protein n=1 Tax=Acinetobacter terrestris TaxID=2529843 RepID=UPI0014906796|nr:acyl-CoA dehydrogenase C-terminal domain-containing protein [Acinetobacter terrestris]NNH36739.1 acyl-CoA dehydrogenase [Acinetobacter terrestris]
MPDYIAPRRDMNFVLNEVLNIEESYSGFEYYQDKVSAELFNQYLDVAADFCQNEILPLNAVGDRQGCTLKDGVVTTPDGFKAAYDKYVELGFPSLTAREEFGGQGLPNLLRTAIQEMTTACNWAWGMYPSLSHGAMRTINHHGTEQQKQIYLPKLISGQWTGTMCLTEAQAGSDLGQVRTKAVPNEDGSYAISGEKIFISAGDHDLAENIVHIVLARLPNAPAGTRGISLFIVPKFNVDAEGNKADRNNVVCSSLEHKMGIHGNATCVLNFDAARGYLIGPEHKGLLCMFTFMNAARLSTATQGLAISEASYQGALAYAKDRLALRALGGAQFPKKAADPIIVHPAVRSMLLTQKAFAEGGRILTYLIAHWVDVAGVTQDAAEKKKIEDLLALLTPIAKAFLTEMGVECSKHGMQVFGGHGYISEHGMEQLARDMRIACLYEGTTEIQAIDLLGRKILKSDGVLLNNFTGMIEHFIAEHQNQTGIQPMLNKLSELLAEWKSLTDFVAEKAKTNPDETGAASVDYLYFSGYVTLAYVWAKAAQVAQSQIAAGSTDEFYQAKLATAQFYYSKLLNRTKTHAANILEGGEVVFSLDPEAFKFD